MPTAALVDAHRRDLLTLTGLAGTDLEALFRQIATADAARDALMDVLPQLVSVYGEAAAALAADWYDEVRESDDVAGGFRAIPAELPDRERTDSLARWGVQPLFAAEPDFGTSLAKVSGGLQRIVADADRQTVIGSLRADPKGRGWSRRTSGGCDFCQMIAGRGAVYSAETADFAAHDDCGCIAVPVIGNHYVEVKAFTPSPRRGGSKPTADKADESRDVDSDRTTEQLRTTLASLESSLAKFDSPGTRQRVEDLRRTLAART